MCAIFTIDVELLCADVIRRQPFGEGCFQCISIIIVIIIIAITCMNFYTMQNIQELYTVDSRYFEFGDLEYPLSSR